MRKTPLAFATTALAILAMIVLASGSVYAGNPGQQLEPPGLRLQPRTAPPGQAVVTLSFVVTNANGAAVVASGTTDSLPLAPGRSFVFHVEAGSQGRPDLGLAGIGGPDAGLAVTGGPDMPFFYWGVKVQPVAVDDETVTLSIEWTRSDETPSGGREVGAGDTRTVTLREGQYHLLDFLSKRPGMESKYANIRVQVDVVIGRDPAIASRRLGYDVWLVDQDANGQEVTRRLQSVAAQGETLPLHFFPLGFGRDGSVASDPWSADVAVNIDGWVKGRLARDGSVQLLVYTSRAVRAGNVEGTTDWGEKRFATRLDEPIRLDIPQSSARLSPALAGHRMSLTITVRAR